ncbi:sporulation integral membrane protein YlbJ [Gracilibacillus kekensis]|uniref:Sporulation integral membrane protein YlbJ n=1 Tax=Gracilibacillus kekensis TaxID=1027249 RepID=A0A1M7MAP2_9BACI|nr:sporulation integral membrane protein YlbJ [Gracilibacillus kekensis]SHM87376.1 sporulation integral membrane protein YlbJ [Gracilibacillus kekensis]
MNQKLYSIIYASISVFIAVMVIYFPQEVLKASQRGLEVWANVVFPSLLPFFIVAELLIAFGVVHFIGVLCEPIMRPLFNVPGVGGFVWTMGMASGYPSGAKFTARLRQEGQLTKTEAERLVTFTNASNPLFIIGAVSIGFFYDHQLGILLAITHYLSNFCVGVCMRFYKYHEKKSYRFQNFSISKAFQQLHLARIKEKRALGKILGDSVTNSIQTLLVIGGFIILFSVLTEIMREIHLAHFFAGGIAILLQLFHLPIEMALPLFTGFFEITIGANEVSQTESSILIKAVFVSIILAFNGFSVQAQVASILAETDIRFAPYFLARILHAVFACFIVILLYVPVYKNQIHSTMVSFMKWEQPPLENIQFLYRIVEQFGFFFTLMALSFYLILLIKQK